MAMLTTVDNPFNPYTQWDDWFAFDERHGYLTPQLLARVVVHSEDLGEGDLAWSEEIAINEIVLRNETGFYRKVEPPW